MMLAGMTMLAAAAAEAAHEAAKSGLPQLNTHTFTPQLFWLALTFGALYFIMSKIALPRIGEVITDRRDRIARDLEAAARLKGDTDKALADYEKSLADARAKASGIAKDTRDALAKETGAEKARVETQIGAKIAQAEARIAETKKKALTAVNDIAGETAAAVVAKLIGQNVDAADVKKALQPQAGE
jgi:F-type H+-transporting ATPase subunit b